MSESPDNGNGLKVKTAFGEIAAKGPMVFVVIALAALTGLSVWEHYKRHLEHEHMECTIQLTLYFQTLPKGTPIIWNEIPAEYWPCLPRTLIDERKTVH